MTEVSVEESGKEAGGGLLGGIGGNEIRGRLVAGELRCGDVAEALINAVGDDQLHAWAAFEPSLVRQQAVALDALAGPHAAALPLFGVPVGIKDLFDTAEQPTAYGSSIYAHHRPTDDAATVSRLRAAGALIAGKLATAEFAFTSPAATRNPIDPSRSPGGSSSGSAAAVGMGTVPLATGTQTAGSISRPASYCGVLGYKPTFGVVDRAGVKLVCPTLDTVGLLGRELEDVRLGAIALGVASLASSMPAPDVGRVPLLAFARTELWMELEPEAAAAIEEWLEGARRSGLTVSDLDFPGYAHLAEAQMTIQLYEMARSLEPEVRDHRSELSAELRDAIEHGLAIPEPEYRGCLSTAAEQRSALSALLGGYDTVLTPSVTGVPPVGIESTGDPLFCRAWTLLGAPSLSVPLVWTSDGLPVGLQLIAAPGDDRGLFEAAGTLLSRFGLLRS